MPRRLQGPAAAAAAAGYGNGNDEAAAGSQCVAADWCGPRWGPHTRRVAPFSLPQVTSTLHGRRRGREKFILRSSLPPEDLLRTRNRRRGDFGDSFKFDLDPLTVRCCGTRGWRGVTQVCVGTDETKW